MSTQSNHETSALRATATSAFSARRSDARSDVLDADSQRWVTRLRPGADGYEQAVEELRMLLLKAAAFEVRRRAATARDIAGPELDDLVQQSADDALMAVLAKLDDFRGDSRFTTWAYKFALLEAGVAVRRRAWRGRDVQLDSDAWSTIADRTRLPHEEAEARELIVALQGAIADELTAHQREVLVAITLNDVPIDVLAERLQTTRGAIYKTLHDARSKLRYSLAGRGLAVGSVGAGGVL